jgi:formylmethanofuran dehydrogenase subunit E
MSEYIPDYNDLYEAFEAEEEEKSKRLPKCDCCGNPIAEEHFYNIDGTYICEGCMKEEYRVNTQDYMED